MIPYYILFLIIISFYVMYRNIYVKYNEKSQIIIKRNYIIGNAVILSLFMGLRSTNVGCDLPRYISRYNEADHFFKMGREPSEWGYNYISYFFHSILKVDFHFFLFVISCFCIISLIICISRYSDNFLISVIIYLSVGLFTMNMSGVRQTLAISISMIAIILAEKRKLALFLALILIASTIHNSALICIPVYWLWGVKINKRQGLVILIVSIAAYIYRLLLNPIIAYFSPKKYDVYDLSAGYNINILVLLVPICFAIFSLMVLPVDEYEKLNETNSFFFIYSCIYILMLMLSLNNNQLGRLSYYFSLGNIITVANGAVSNRKHDENHGLIIDILIIVLSSLYFFISTPGGTLQIDNYTFFWK